MIDPLISCQLLGGSDVFRSGETLRAAYQIDAVAPDQLQAVEASVMWYTEGKGDEDIGVHYFQRRTAGDASDGDLRTLYPFETRLPNSPLSYSGEIVKIRWCVRVRLFLRSGKDYSWQTHFSLAPAAVVQPQP